MNHALRLSEPNSPETPRMIPGFSGIVDYLKGYHLSTKDVLEETGMKRKFMATMLLDHIASRVFSGASEEGERIYEEILSDPKPLPLDRVRFYNSLVESFNYLDRVLEGEQ